MIMNKRILFISGLVFLAFACNLPSGASTPAANLLATLSASTPLSASTNASIPSTLSPSTEPTGKIVFTCQIYKDQTSEQICIMNTDGSNYLRLTIEDDIRHFYPSISPDGRSVVYSAFNKQSKHYEIYEMDLSTSENKALTYAIGDVNAPEISPDGKTIVFTRYINDPEKPNIWLMDRNGSNLRQVSAVPAWDPTWSPNGNQIAFNSGKGLFVMDSDGKNLSHLVDSTICCFSTPQWQPQP